MYNDIISVAPMMDYTDTHCRYLHRLISKKTLLYTEMVTANAIVYGDASKWLYKHAGESPVAFQLGGNDPKLLAEAARQVADAGFDQINLNVGCPSDRVKKGRFGLSLMAEPDLVSNLLETMQKAVNVPVTLKTRIGYDHHDDYETLHHFIQQTTQSGIPHVTIHARIGWLQGLSPKENRNIPPLQYERVYQLKQDFPALHIGINGGITGHEAITTHLNHVDHVMIGRAAFNNPYLLAEVDQRYYGMTTPIPSREAILAGYQDYIDNVRTQGTFSHTTLIKPILGLYHGQPGAKAFKQQMIKR